MSEQADPVLAQLVSRVSDLEKLVATIASREASIGNMRCIGGNHGNGQSFNTSSTSFVDLGGSDYTKITVEKVGESTDLLIPFNLTAYSTVASAVDINIGVRIDSTDYAGDPNRLNANVIDTYHEGWGHFAAIAGIGAGTHDVELRVRIGAGADSFDWNDGDIFSFLVIEVPATLTFS